MRTRNTRQHLLRTANLAHSLPPSCLFGNAVGPRRWAKHSFLRATLHAYHQPTSFVCVSPKSHNTRPRPVDTVACAVARLSIPLHPLLCAYLASADFSARLWDAVTGDQVHEFVHKHIVKTVHFAADRSKLATAGHEGILRIFDVGSPGSPPTEVCTAVI